MVYYLNIGKAFYLENLPYESSYEIKALGKITSNNNVRRRRITVNKLHSRKIALAHWRHPTARRNVKSYVKSYVKSTFNMH